MCGAGCGGCGGCGGWGGCGGCGGWGGCAAGALHHVNLLLAVFAGACLSTGARLRWDPSLYVAVREALPAEYRVVAAAVPAAGAALLALAHLALAATAPARRPRRILLYMYAGLTALAVALELGVLGWVASRVVAFTRSAEAAEMQELLATREHLAPLLHHLARWHPLPERLRAIIQEAEEDLPWNGYVAAAALGALLLLQLAGAALALLAARGPAPARPSTPLSRRAPHAAFSASRVSLVNSFRSSASSRSGLSVRSVRSDRTPTAEHAPLKAKYKNGRIVPVPV